MAATSTEQPRRVLPTLVRSFLADGRDVLAATDPGLLRLRLGLRAVIAVLLVIAVQRVVAPLVGIPTVVAMLFGGMVAMNGSFATSSRRPRDAAWTVAAFPLVGLVGMLPASLLHGHPLPELFGFVAVMTGAVYVRRFGPRWFNYGMFAWLAYFFTVFVGFRPGQLGDLLAIVASAAACVALAAAVLVPDRPDRLLTAALRSFEVRVDALLGAGIAALDGRLPADRASRVLHGRAFRVVEAALIVDGYLAGAASDDDHAAAVRHDLLEVELSAEEIASAAAAVARASDVPADARAALLEALAAARSGDVARVRQAADQVQQAVEVARASGSCDGSGRRLLDAAEALGRLAHAREAHGREAPPHVGTYEPAVPLFLGNLPGSAGSALSAVQQRDTWWSRRTLNTRLCVQVALAASLTVAAGHALSSQRYYWAVLACFLTMTGTFTTGETLVKGASRVIGTVLGLVAATVAVHVTGRSDTAVVAVMVGCVFLGLYLFRVSYVFMAFAVTTVMGELYNVLQEFSDALLVLRLEETALGAAIAIVVALVVLPIRTTDAQAAAERALLAQVSSLLEDVRDRLGEQAEAPDLFRAARLVDGKLHQLALVARPAGGATLLGLSGRRAERDLSRWTATAYRARALAAAASAVEAGSHAYLASRAESLRASLAGSASAQARGSDPTAARVERALDDLEAVLEPIVGVVAQERVEHTPVPA